MGRRKNPREHGAKVPKFDPKIAPAREHTPKVAPGSVSDPRQRNPIWRFGRMYLADADFGWGKATAQQWMGVLRRLGEYGQMAWTEIEDSSKSNHAWPKNELPKAMVKLLRAQRQDDTDGMYQLQITGAQRVWGFRVSEEFWLFAWDPGHLVYETKRGADEKKKRIKAKKRKQ